MKIKRNAGFTLVEIMIVVAIIGLLAAIAIPSFMRARQNTQTNTCLNNLRLIDGAKNQWALESGRAVGAAVVIAELEAYIKAGVPTCPIGAIPYDLQAIGTDPICLNDTSPGGNHPAKLN